MSYGHVVGLAAKILKAQRRIARARQAMYEDETAENVVRVMVAQAYMAGLCEAMAPLAKDAAMLLDTGGGPEQDRLERILNEGAE